MPLNADCWSEQHERVGDIALALYGQFADDARSDCDLVAERERRDAWPARPGPGPSCTSTRCQREAPAQFGDVGTDAATVNAGLPRRRSARGHPNGATAAACCCWCAWRERDGAGDAEKADGTGAAARDAARQAAEARSIAHKGAAPDARRRRARASHGDSRPTATAARAACRFAAGRDSLAYWIRVLVQCRESLKQFI